MFQVTSYGVAQEYTQESGNTVLSFVHRNKFVS